MNKQLRNRHLLVWRIMAVLIPVGILAAYWAIPCTAKVKFLEETTANPLPLVLKSTETANYRVYIRSGVDGSGRSSLQIEWQNKHPLSVPSALLYRRRPGTMRVEDNELLGRIEAKGNYLFPLFQDSTETGNVKLILYDFIHQVTLDSLNFSL